VARVTTLRTTRNRWTTPIAALLLAIQALAGGAVPLAHAGERETAPAGFEAHHSDSCIVIHDALRCALCWYAGSLVTPPVTPAGPRAAVTAQRLAQRTVTVASTPAFSQSQPRAPPLPLS